MRRGLGIIFSSLVFAIFVFSFYGCTDDKVSKDVNSINLRLEKIEDRLSNIEKSSKRVGILEAEFQKLQQSMDAWERAITARLAPVSKEKASSQAKTAKSRKKGKHYVVERGDSLFRIAQKHKMTVDQLCKLNKITKNTVLHPGVKLLVY